MAGLYYKGTFSNAKDCITTGVYYNYEGNAAGLPSEIGKQIMMVVITCPQLLIQEVTSYITGRVYRRIVNLSQNDWSIWQRVDNV